MKVYLDEDKNLYIEREEKIKGENIIFIKFKNWVLNTDLTHYIFDRCLDLLIFEKKINIDNYYDNVENLKLKEVDLKELDNLTIEEIEKIKNEDISKLKREHLRFWATQKTFNENNEGKKIKLTIKINDKEYPKDYSQPICEYDVIFDKDIVYFQIFLNPFNNDLIKSTITNYEEIITNFELI